ncbi:MAG: hypothetical protein ACRETO_00475 [Gammaproteobacteria bacterium]
MSGIMRPGSTWWLLANMFKINWRHRRTTQNLVGSVLLWILIAIFWLILHGAALALFLAVGTHAGAGLVTPKIYAVAGILFWVVCAFTLLRAMPAAATAMFERNSLDLLLASPIPARSILTVLGLTVAANCIALPAFFLTPFANVALFLGWPQLLAVYPSLAAVSLLVTALSMLAMLGLIARLGLPRARKFVRVAGMLLIAAWVMATQLNALLRHGQGATVHVHPAAWQPGAWLTIPGKMVLGAPLQLIVFCAVALAVFGLVVTYLQKTYLAGMGQADESVVSDRGRDQQPRRKWRAGLFRTVLWKEWRLIYRDPQLLSQIFLQLIGLLFAPFILMQQFHVDIVMVVGVVVIITGGMLAEVLAWLALCAEDAPALLAAAPVSRSLLIRYKMLAAQVPVWILATPAFLYMAWHRPLVSAGVALMFMGATWSTAAVMLWSPVPGSRHMRLAKRKRSLLDGAIMLLTVLGWAIAAYGIGSAHWIAILVGLLLGLTAPLVSRWRGTRREFSLGY